MSVVKNFAIAIDQAINCLIKLKDGWGTPDETLSARAWRLRREHPWLKKFIDSLFFREKNHCFESWINEVRRRQIHRDYLD